MRLGRYELLPVETGRFALDGGAMFGVVPRALWQRAHPPDELGRIPLALRALLARELDEHGRPTGFEVLVDTGIGTKWDAKHASIYQVDHADLSLERGLAAYGLTPEDIDAVLLTHLHFDHAGGATKRDGRGDLVPTFPNAVYYVQERNLAWARNPTEKDRASYLAENFEPLARAGVLETLDGPGTFRDGIELVLSNGHTEAMQLPLFRGPEGALLYCADLVPTASHVRVPWVMAYDNRPLVTIEEKKGLLARAAAEGWWLFFEHDPDAPAARVEDTPKGFVPGARSDLSPPKT